MKIDVISEKENLLLERNEYVVRISHAGSTPKKAEIRDKLIAKLGAKTDTLVLDSLAQTYGSPEAVAKVRVYKSNDRALQLEHPHIIKKNFPVIEKSATESEEKEEEPEKPSEPKPAEKKKTEKPAKESEEKAVEAPEAKEKEAQEKSDKTSKTKKADKGTPKEKTEKPETKTESKKAVKEKAEPKKAPKEG